MKVIEWKPINNFNFEELEEKIKVFLYNKYFHNKNVKQ